MIPAHLASNNVLRAVSIFCVLLACRAKLSAGEQAEAKFTVQLVDEKNSPIMGATVRAGFNSSRNYWAGDRSEMVMEGQTNADGKISFQGKTIGEWGASFSAAGYYRSWTGSIIGRKRVSGQWEPWNASHTLTAKKILKPVAMYARRVNELKVPVFGKAAGFDLIKCDWVPPYGSGEHSDITFTMTSNFSSPLEKFDVSLIAAFPDAEAGILSILAPPFVGSELRLPRYAPESGYANMLSKRLQRREAGVPVVRDFRVDQNYFFRTRTVVRESRVVSALYGKIHGDIEFGGDGFLRFTYYLNPNANDRNMEFDHERNLFPNLGVLERVREP